MANLTDLPPELLEGVLVHLPYDELSKHHTVGLSRALLASKSFWVQRAHILLGVSPEDFDRRWPIEEALPLQELSLGGQAQSRYVELVCRQRKVVIGSEYFLYKRECLFRAIEQKDDKLIQHFQGDRLVDYQELKVAAKAGNVEFFLKHVGMDRTSYLYEIGFSGEERLLALVDPEGPRKEYLLMGLIAGQHLTKAEELFGSLGRLDFYHKRFMLYGAAESGNLELVMEIVRDYSAPNEHRYSLLPQVMENGSIEFVNISTQTFTMKVQSHLLRPHIIRGGSIDVYRWLRGEGYLDDVNELEIDDFDAFEQSGNFHLLREPEFIALLPNTGRENPPVYDFLNGRFNLEGVHFLLETKTWGYPKIILTDDHWFEAAEGSSKAVRTHFIKTFFDPDDEMKEEELEVLKTA